MTGIEWTDRTWNPVVGCRPVSSGCANCYAATMARRLEAMGSRGYERTADGLRIAEGSPGKPARFTGSVRTLEDRLETPLRWREPGRVFVCSMSDLFYGDEADRAAAERAGIPFAPVPFEFLDRVFAVMALASSQTFQILTKRPGRMLECLVGPDRTDQDRRIDIANAADRIGQHKGSHKGWMPVFGRPGFYLPPWPLPNVILGTSVETTDHLDRIDTLGRCPAAAYFVSVEPLLGPFDAFGPQLAEALEPLTDAVGPDRVQVIIGGESGPDARPCRLEWIRDVVALGTSVGARVFVKQLGRRVRARPDELRAWGASPGCDHVARKGLAMAPDAAGTVPATLHHNHGGEPEEWPSDLRRREEIELGGSR